MLLRRWERTDIACVREAKGFADEEAMAWIEGQWRRGQDGAGISLAITEAGSGEALGCIGLLVRPQPGTVPTGHGEGLVFATQPGTVGIGYWVLGRARGRGLATRAVVLLVRWAIEDTGMGRIEALVEPDNVPSQRVVEHAGFHREGHLRAYLDLQPDGRRGDALVYSLLRGDL